MEEAGLVGSSNVNNLLNDYPALVGLTQKENDKKEKEKK